MGLHLVRAHGTTNVSPACSTQEQSDRKEREKPPAAMRASLKAVGTRRIQAFIPASLGASSGQVGPVCLVQRDRALSVMKGEGREEEGPSPRPPALSRLRSGMQISRLLETLASQIILSPSAGPQCAGDVMTMVALATTGRRGAAGCGCCGDFLTLACRG